jgi:hypothetical protein
MSYLSYDFLEQNYSPTTVQKRAALFEAKASTPAQNIFLSHSTKDDAHVDRVVLFFADFNAEEYSDNGDKELPARPDPETARLLKQRIDSCARFVVLVSPNSQASAWIPWELGVADGLKGVAPIAILPITPAGDEEAWTKEVYFGLYPRIMYNRDQWIVHDPRDGKYWTLYKWIHNHV